MPDLATSLYTSETLTLTPLPTTTTTTITTTTSTIPTPTLKPCIQTLIPNKINPNSTPLPIKISSIKFKLSKSDSPDLANNSTNKNSNGKIRDLDEYVREWKERKSDLGVPQNRCFFPFLTNSPKLAVCRACSKDIFPGDEVSCSVGSCAGVYHLKCAKDELRCSGVKKFKCPQHACFVCKQKLSWRCVRCEVASHDKCAAWPDEVVHLSERPGWTVCWRHPKDWRQEKYAAPVNTFEDVFSSLPLPYIEQEFKIEHILKDGSNDKLEQPPYVHIRRNVYLVKKKREDACLDSGCTCSSTCSENCVCSVQSISCSKACRCSEACTNRPFRKEKKIKIVKTELCGWGVEAAEPIKEGDFIIEYVGEVVDDIVCTQRLWDMKNKNVKNFYMCEIRKDFTIDATFKGNASRFLNHSCDPNCKLEKWQVEGETRVGVFAARSIEVGEPLTYDYRFVQFGPEVKCHCGAANCQGYLGAKRKIDIPDSNRMRIADLSWGSGRRKRSKTSFWLKQSRCS